MCGITGSLNLRERGYTIDSARIQFAMLLMSTLRGVDGTGIVVGPLDQEKRVTYHKEAVPATSFTSRSDMAEMTRSARFVIAHTRAATLGGVTDEACHPFSAGSVCGVHNGTIHSIRSIFPKIEGINDSEIVYKALSEVEPDKATEVLAELEVGAYALVWYDSRINALRFARNEDRPLWFYKDDSMWWWASEPGTIAASISSVKKKALSYRDVEPWQLATHTLMTVPLNGEEATAETYEPSYTPAPYSYQGYQGRGNSQASLMGGDQDWWGNYYDSRGFEGTRRTDGGTRTVIDDGWVSLYSGDQLYRQEPWFTNCQAQVRVALSRLFKSGVGRSTIEFKANLASVAERTDTVTATGDTATVAFAAQCMNPVSGMVYGALDVHEWGPLPVVGLVSEEQLAIHNAGKDAMPKDSTKVALWTADLDNIRVYHEGSLGAGLTDINFMGWVEKDEAISMTESAAGSTSSHPHLAADTWKTPVDWSAWYTV